jgi:REP element-mobilizing transposase RayT
MNAAIYTPHNGTPAYQIDWSYSLFWHEAPQDFRWVSEFQRVCEPDHIRVLQHAFQSPNVSQFLISTRPEIMPLLIVQRLKGRLQHLIRTMLPNAFRRNYSLRSIGSTRREKLDHYLASQLQHHRPADPRVEARLESYQIHHREVDLMKAERTSHAIYWYNLHLVFVNDERWQEVRAEPLQRLRNMIEAASRAKGHRLSRAAIVPDHIHLTMGCKLEESPQEVALSYMNNLAYASGMKPVFKYSYYAGTFSEYDLGVIPRHE